MVLMALACISGTSAFTFGFTTVDPGEVGVVISPYGGGSEGTSTIANELQPGFHLVMPGKDVIKYDTRVQTYNMNAAEGNALNVMSNEGLTILVDASVNYRIVPNKADEIHNLLGPKYSVFVENKVRSTIPIVISNCSVSEFISLDRQKNQDQMLIKLNEELNPYNIIVESVNLRKVELPNSVKSAIEAKQVAEQEKQKMVQTLEIAKQKQQQVEIEANATAAKIRIEADAQAYALQVVREELAKEGGAELLEQQKTEMLGKQNIDVMIIPEGTTPVVTTSVGSTTAAAVAATN